VRVRQIVDPDDSKATSSKGTRADFARAASCFVHFVAFPVLLDGYRDPARARRTWISTTSPIQLAIRLLTPAG
jgi:hypothetical protein